MRQLHEFRANNRMHEIVKYARNCLHDQGETEKIEFPRYLLLNVECIESTAYVVTGIIPNEIGLKLY